MLGSRPAVEVDALPAAKLLWGRADRVELRFPRASIVPFGLGEQLARTDATDELDARIDELTIGPIALRGAMLRKEGSGLSAGAVAERGNLVNALPEFLELRPVPSARRRAGLRRGRDRLRGPGRAARAAARGERAAPGPQPRRAARRLRHGRSVTIGRSTPLSGADRPIIVRAADLGALPSQALARKRVPTVTSRWATPRAMKAAVGAPSPENPKMNGVATSSAASP